MRNEIKEFVKLFEELYPQKLSEEWDNTGLLLGSPSNVVRKALICMDVTRKVFEEALENNVELIISHHPLIFKPLKRIVDTDTRQKLLMDLIKSNISVISLHTNLDAAKAGVNDTLATKIGLQSVKNVKNHKYDIIFKLVVYVPETHGDAVMEAICSQGAGYIGNYSHCAFRASGTGSFKPLEGTNPFIGAEGVIQSVAECKIETVVKENDLEKVINAMKEAHPYEEVAYDIIPLNIETGYSYAKVGELKKPVNAEEFVANLKSSLGLDYVRTAGKKDIINRVVVFSGSFDGNLDIIKRSNADVLVTGDVKYHNAVDAIEEGFMIVDCGHYGTEVVVLEELKKVLNTNFSEVEVKICTAQEEPFKVV